MTLPDSMFLGEISNELHTAVRCMDSLAEEFTDKALFRGDTYPGQCEIPYLLKVVAQLNCTLLALIEHRRGFDDGELTGALSALTALYRSWGRRNGHARIS